MQRLRSTWWTPGVVALMAASLLALVLGPSSGAVSETTAAHESWLRAHLSPQAIHADEGSVPASSVENAVDAALDAARADAAPTLEGFTEAFAAAYRQQGAPVPLSTLFAIPDVGQATLYALLSQRALQLSRTALLPRLTLSTAPPATTSGRSPAVLHTQPVPALKAARGVLSTVRPSPRILPCILRTLFSARPMAP